MEWYKNDADPFTVKSHKTGEYGKKYGIYIRTQKDTMGKRKEKYTTTLMKMT